MTSSNGVLVSPGHPLPDVGHSAGWLVGFCGPAAASLL